MRRVVLSLGCNLGDRHTSLRRMITALRYIVKGPVALSSIMETEPVDVADDQPWYLNVVLRAQYAGSAYQLLLDCQAIEWDLGRTGKGTKTARTADIDILLFGNKIIKKRDLIIPHPRILKRYFCMRGLLEIAPGTVVPGTHTTIRRLYKLLPDDIINQKIRIRDL